MVKESIDEWVVVETSSKSVKRPVLFDKDDDILDLLVQWRKGRHDNVNSCRSSRQSDQSREAQLGNHFDVQFVCLMIGILCVQGTILMYSSS